MWMTRCIESYREGNCDEPCFQIGETIRGSVKKDLGKIRKTENFGMCRRQNKFVFELKILVNNLQKKKKTTKEIGS